MRRLTGIIDSMTSDERRNPSRSSIRAAAAASPPAPESSRMRSTNWSSSSTAWPT